MALTFFWRCEGTTFSGTDDYSAGDTTPDDNSSGSSISAAQSFAGSNSILLDDSFETYIFDSASIVDADAEFSFAFSFYINTWNEDVLFAIIDASETANHVWVSLTGTAGSGNLDLNVRRDLEGNTSVATTGANLTTSTWYSVVCRVDPVNQDLRIEVYNSSGTEIGTAGENLAVTATHFPQESAIDQIWIGNSFSQDLHIDNILIADAYDEALEDNLDITSYTNYSTSDVSGSGTPSFPSITMSGSGSVSAGSPDVYVTGGAASITMPSVTMSGSGQGIASHGSGSPSLPSITMSGSGLVVTTITGSGTPSFPLITMSGSAQVVTPGFVSGSGALIMPAVTMSGMDTPDWGAGPFTTELEWRMYRKRKWIKHNE